MSIDIEQANKKAVETLLAGQPVLTDIALAASEAVPGMKKTLVLHAGPPIKWENMSGPMKGAVIGGLIYEKLAGDEAGAAELAGSGKIEFSPWHEHSGVGPMAGVGTAGMPVFIVENTRFGNKAYCTFNEGLGKVLRYGAFSEEVITRLNWMRDVLAPVLKEALKITGPINLKNLIAQAVQMGDEGHNRNKAGNSLFYREIAPGIIGTAFSQKEKTDVLKFINSNDHFFLNLTMPAMKCSLAAAEWIEGSTMVTTMARNGTEFGIRVSGLKDRWFTGPAGLIRGLYFQGYSDADANPDIGDSAITETGGIGGFAMAGAPAMVRFVGGTASDAMGYTLRMYDITLAENNVYQIPALDFRGTPTGIDIRKVIENNILPQINTGIAHKKAGIGQVGAGLVNPPVKCFEDALTAFAEQYGF